MAGVPNEGFEVLGQAIGQYIGVVLGELVTEASFRKVLQSLQDGDPDVLALMVPFMFAELEDILAKDESQLTPAERSYVDALGRLIPTQRVAAAEQGLKDYCA